MTVLFWDIDGTLITTARAGMFAWNDSVRELTGRDFDLRTGPRTAGLTDYQIAVKTFEFFGITPDPPLIERLVRRYEELLPASLPLRRGYVFPNVREILESLRERPGIRSYLLTGNTRGGARAKLIYYGLMEFFSDGAFAEDAGERASIAVRALELAKQRGGVAEGGVFVIGDTPHDVECASAIDARTIAVATGGYTIEELQAYHPWRVFNELPPVGEFVRLIDEARGGTDMTRVGRTLSA
ncbi:MAG: haloacid dehalogenase-like hydrolase [Acidobacteria bacterium]|nr:haloacid dehalogenase-like hydrolase [Acidobacteriota bacterium]